MSSHGFRLLERVPLAWPTLGMLAGSWALWVLSTLGAVTGYLPWGVAIVLNAVASFLVFTPLHEGIHRAVGRSRVLNVVVGVIGGLPVMIPFYPFNYIHLEHHRHTNDPQRDPDLWSGVASSRWWLPLRWATQDLYYYVWYVRRWSSRPVAERIGTVATLGGMLVVGVGATMAGWGDAVLLLWVLPARLAIVFLAGLFDYLPHHPHGVSAHEDRYQATRVLDHAWMGPLLQNQHLHVIHHLYPAVPFYRYPQVWAELGPQLRARGVRIERLWSRSEPHPPAATVAIPARHHIAAESSSS